MILKEYTEYNNLIERFKEEIDKIVKKIVNPTKQELQKLQQIVNKK
jgi:preprotein translocase subunit Sss1